VAPAIDGLPDGVTILPMAGAIVPEKPTKRKRPGRPKASRLDHPLAAGGMRDIAIGFTPTLEPAIAEPMAATDATTAQEAPEPAPSHQTRPARRLNDIVPTRNAPACLPGLNPQEKFLRLSR